MKDKWNIVLYVNSFLPQTGGRELVVHYLARTLTMMGHEVRVLGSAGWWRCRKFRFEYPVHRWPTLKGLFPEHVYLTQLLLDTTLWPCDVIHAHSTYPAGYMATRLKRLRNLPLVITPHGDDVHVIPDIGRGLRLRPHLRAKIQQALARAELVTAISSSVASSCLEAGAPQAKIRRIPNGVDLERFRRSSSVNIRDRLGLPPDSRLILTVGNYSRARGHEDLIHAMSTIVARAPKACLLIVGARTEVLRPLIRELNLPAKVILTGPITHPVVNSARGGASFDDSSKDWLAALYQSSDVYVSAGIAEGAEGLSLALLEAMAAGRTVVATKISGNRDVIQNGVHGFLVPPADPNALAAGVLQILANTEQQNRMGTEAQKLAEKYEWRAIARQYIDVYREARETHRLGTRK